MSRQVRRRLAIATILAMVAGVAVLGFRFADDGMVYYRTPSELTSVGTEPVTRLSGLVVPGSVHRSAEESSLRLSDGATDIEVRFPGRLPGTILEGEGAVVEGHLVAAGLFHADRVLLRHSNEYRPAESG
jgi:cytochrome c-type biogenesis protein CcmE